MLKKILIITLYGNNNYGNKLQNYALQQTLNKRDYNVETLINNYVDEHTKTLKQKSKYKSIAIFLKAVFYKIIGIMKKIFFTPKDECIVRKKKFLEFEKQHIHNSEFLIQKNLDKLIANYDYLVIGSDQVWNPSAMYDYKVNLGMFQNNTEKFFSYAASFGISEIPEYWKDIYFKGLKNINYISVREDAGAKIIKDLIGRDVPVLVDPTMLLTAEEWRKIEIQPENAKNKKYLLTYFLGKISKKRKAFFDKIAKENNLEIINMVQITEPETYVAGPSEFLSYIDNASVVFTDSFHACVFSILFKTPFYVLDREDNSQNMNSRLDTLLGKFKLEDRKLNSYSDEVPLKVDYSHTDEILEQERKKSDEFLRKALNIGE